MSTLAVYLIGVWTTVLIAIVALLYLDKWRS